MKKWIISHITWEDYSNYTFTGTEVELEVLKEKLKSLDSDPEASWIFQSESQFIESLPPIEKLIKRYEDYSKALGNNLNL